TIHHAKGLEWPVVFVAGLLSQYRGGTDAVFKVRKNLSLTEVYHKAFLSDEKNELLKENEKNQAFQENERAIYVAWTRAQTKLYAPLLSPIDKNKSPMSLYYEKLFGDEFWKEKMSSPSRENLEKLFREWVAAHPFPPEASCELVNAVEKSPNKLHPGETTRHLEDAIIPTTLDESHIKKEKKSRTSFSGLTQGDTLRLSVDEKPEDENETPEAETILSVVVGTLSSEEAPAGNETGNVIHQLLEIFPHKKLDAANATELLANPEFKNSLDAAVSEHLPLSAERDDHKLGLAELVRRAAICRLPMEKDGLPFFRLADVGEEKLAEADFLAGLSLREKLRPANFPGFKN
ncbi:MAG: hypothetical protein JNM63_00420, partial [Spirochaetia bacterium]|nr:hypothetical protein [Spirochaetia bacterium]